jgi:hypothetical protein
MFRARSSGAISGKSMTVRWYPEKYPAHSSQVYRDRLKKNFLTAERSLQEQEARARAGDLGTGN